MSLTRILLIRHGPPARPHSARWLNAAGYERWRSECDVAGIQPQKGPPVSVQKAVAVADVIVSSDLPRAVESAERLAQSRTVVQTSLLRETPLPIPATRIPLPAASWEGVTHLAWLYGILHHNDITQRDAGRARAALAWIERLEHNPSVVAVVTHGVFRRLLARELLRNGWREETRRRSYRCWSLWSFTNK